MKAAMPQSRRDMSLTTITASALTEAAWYVSDTEGDGHISRTDLEVVMRHKQLPTPMMEVLFVVDEDRDRQLEQHEFRVALAVTAMASAEEYSSREVLSAA